MSSATKTRSRPPSLQKQLDPAALAHEIEEAVVKSADNASCRRLWILSTKLRQIEKGSDAAHVLGVKLALKLLHSFTDFSFPDITRRWIGLLLHRLLEQSSPTAILLSNEGVHLEYLGRMIQDASEDLKLVTGVIIRGIIIATGISHHRFWPSATAHSQTFPPFPTNESQAWVEGFQNFVDNLVEMSPAADTNSSIAYALQVTAPDGTKITSTLASIIVIIEGNRVLVAIPPSSNRDHQYIDIPLAHIRASTVRSQEIVDDEGVASDYISGELALTLGSETWTYTFNAEEKYEEQLSILFKNEADAAEVAATINEFPKNGTSQSSNQAFRKISQSSILDVSQPLQSDEMEKEGEKIEERDSSFYPAIKGQLETSQEQMPPPPRIRPAQTNAIAEGKPISTIRPSVGNVKQPSHQGESSTQLPCSTAADTRTSRIPVIPTPKGAGSSTTAQRAPQVVSQTSSTILPIKVPSASTTLAKIRELRPVHRSDQNAAPRGFTNKLPKDGPKGHFREAHAETEGAVHQALPAKTLQRPKLKDRLLNQDGQTQSNAKDTSVEKSKIPHKPAREALTRPAKPPRMSLEAESGTANDESGDASGSVYNVPDSPEERERKSRRQAKPKKGKAKGAANSKSRQPKISELSAQSSRPRVRKSAPLLMLSKVSVASPALRPTILSKANTGKRRASEKSQGSQPEPESFERFEDSVINYPDADPETGPEERDERNPETETHHPTGVTRKDAIMVNSDDDEESSLSSAWSEPEIEMLGHGKSTQTLEGKDDNLPHPEPAVVINAVDQKQHRLVIDDNLARKSSIISWSAKGPMNQGGLPLRHTPLTRAAPRAGKEASFVPPPFSAINDHPYSEANSSMLHVSSAMQALEQLRRQRLSSEAVQREPGRNPFATLQEHLSSLKKDSVKSFDLRPLSSPTFRLSQPTRKRKADMVTSIQPHPRRERKPLAAVQVSTKRKAEPDNSASQKSKRHKSPLIIPQTDEDIIEHYSSPPALVTFTANQSHIVNYLGSPIPRTASVPESSTPTRQRTVLQEVQTYSNTSDDAGLDIIGDHMESFQDENIPPTAVNHRPAATELFSSNSKPLPAAPQAASRAMSGSVPEQIVTSAEQRNQQAKSPVNPFTTKDARLELQETPFTRSLRGKAEQPIVSPTARLSKAVGASALGGITEEDDPDETLVDDAEEYDDDLVSERYTTDSSTSSTTEIDEEQRMEEELAGDMKWAASLEPHQFAVYKTLVGISKRLILHLDKAQSSLAGIIQEYSNDAVSIIKDLGHLYQNQHEQAIRSKMKHVGEGLESASKRLKGAESSLNVEAFRGNYEKQKNSAARRMEAIGETLRSLTAAH